MYEFPSYPPRPPQVPPWEFTGLSLLLAVILAVVLLRPRRVAHAIDPWHWLIPAAILGVGFTGTVPGSTAAVLEWVIACVLMAAGFVATLVRMPATSRRRFWISLVVVVIGGFALQNVWTRLAQPTTPSYRTWCKSSLMQLGLAMHSYHEAWQAFPAPRQGEVSWRVQLLPYADHQELAAAYNRDAPWSTQSNLKLAQGIGRVYTCPMRYKLVGEESQTYSDYAVPIGAGGLYETEQNSPNYREVADGLSNTIHIVEASGRRIIWNEPRDVNFDQLPIGVNLPGSQPGWSDGVFSSYHTVGTQVGRADGSVRLVNREIDPQVLRSLLLSNDGGPKSVEW